MSPPDSLDASQAVEASHGAREEDRSRDSATLQQPQAVSADGGALSSSESASEPESQSEQQEGARGKPATSPLQPSAAAASSSSSSASIAQSEALAEINQALKGLPIEEFCFAAQRSFEIEDKAEKVRTLRPVRMSQLAEIIDPRVLFELASENSSLEKSPEAVKQWLLEGQGSQATSRASLVAELNHDDSSVHNLAILIPGSAEALKQQQFEERCAQIATGAQVVAGEKFLKETEKIKNAYEQLNALSSRLRKEIPTQLGDEIKNLTFRAESLIPKFQEISKVKHTYDMARSQAVQKPTFVERITELQKLKEKFDNDFIKAKNEFLEAVEMVINTRNKAIAELKSSEPTD
jgi:hypothetical protein